MAKKKRTLLDARLEELEREFSRVQGDIQSLSRAVKNPEAPPRRAAAPAPRPERPSPRPGATQAEESPQPSRFPPSEPASLRGKTPAAPVVPKAPPPADEEVFPELARDRLRNPRAGDNRLARYLSTMDIAGGATGGPRQDKKIIRNKAIFMLVWVAVLLYVVVKLLA